MPKIGAHVSAAGSLELSFEKAEAINADCTQIFISPPQQWAQTAHDAAEVQRYQTKQAQSGIGPNFIHGTYLINLGTDKPELLQKSIDWLTWALNMAGKLDIQGVIFHTGSHKGEWGEKVLNQVGASLKKVLESSSPSQSNNNYSSSEQSESRSTNYPFLILETAASKMSIGNSFQELGQILKLVKDNRLKVCLDLQHSFAAGYDLRTALGLKDVLEEFEQEIGLTNLAAIHANDSKTDYKSGRDRHANIGEGLIGKKGFANIINHPAFKEIPFILEVPGLAGTGPDLENIKILKSLSQHS